MTVSTDTLKVGQPVIVTGIDVIHLSGSALTSFIPEFALRISLQNNLPETVPVPWQPLPAVACVPSTSGHW